MDYLKGIRFADFTWAGAGPFSTKLFSDFGAEIIKVESATRLDPVRAGGPFKDGKPGVNRSGYFASRNTGKRSLSLDLKSEEGHATALELIARSDVVTSNFGPGAMERLGLGYDACRAVAPNIIYLQMPMYGAEGPRANLLGVGMTISAVSGFIWHTAYKPGDPIGPGTHYPDHAANCYHAAFAVLAALRQRRQTGEGTRIELAQVESTINFHGPTFVEWAWSGEEPAQIGNRSPSACPHNVFPSDGEDAWIAIAVESDAAWRTLAGILGGAATDESLATSSARLARIDEVERMVAAWTAARGAEDAAETLRAAGVPAAAVAHARRLIEEDPQLAARHYWQSIEHPELGSTIYNSPPYTVDGERVALKRPPLLGEHNDAILAELRGANPTWRASE
ncbi:CoA transferase [Acuticoccus sp. M5D2P5]|uniref:CaiB/BaiF CoA transferase family protein n=1 Tax=Acuticoccus kalidii TaxID=2910977 RepID=UPI001F38F8B7|nr:CoA transferase [Acuticoccus kalidii]MCF3933729.1 CoA transferase [Acuticoccus kalidii]